MRITALSDDELWRKLWPLFSGINSKELKLAVRDRFLFYRIEMRSGACMEQALYDYGVIQREAVLASDAGAEEYEEAMAAQDLLS